MKKIILILTLLISTINYAQNKSGYIVVAKNVINMNQYKSNQTIAFVNTDNGDVMVTIAFDKDFKFIDGTDRNSFPISIETPNDDTFEITNGQYLGSSYIFLKSRDRKGYSSLVKSLKKYSYIKVYGGDGTYSNNSQYFKMSAKGFTKTYNKVID